MSKEDKDRTSLRHVDTVATAEGKGEVAIAEVDSISPWQCILQNPKIVFWTLYANSKDCLDPRHCD